MIGPVADSRSIVFPCKDCVTRDGGGDSVMVHEVDDMISEVAQAVVVVVDDSFDSYVRRSAQMMFYRRT